MPFSNLSRRSLVLSSLALAACQTTGNSVSPGRAITTAYDGRYQITVSRTRNNTPAMREEIARWGSGPETLAFLVVDVQGGQMRLVSKRDSSAGSNYDDLRGAFYGGGLLELNTTAGYLKGKSSPYRLRISVVAGETLLTAGSVVLRPEGFDADFSAHVEIVRT